MIMYKNMWPYRDLLLKAIRGIEDCEEYLKLFWEMYEAGLRLNKAEAGDNELIALDVCYMCEKLCQYLEEIIRDVYDRSNRELPLGPMEFAVRDKAGKEVLVTREAFLENIRNYAHRLPVYVPHLYSDEDNTLAFDPDNPQDTFKEHLRPIE